MNMRPGMTVLVAVGVVEGPGRRRDILRRPGVVVVYDSKLGATVDVHVLNAEEERALLDLPGSTGLATNIVRIANAKKGDHVGQFLAMP